MVKIGSTAAVPVRNGKRFGPGIYMSPDPEYSGNTYYAKYILNENKTKRYQARICILAQFIILTIVMCR